MFDEGGGYVLFDQKPVCWSGYHAKDMSRPNSVGHKEEIAIRQGLPIWKKLNVQGQNLVLHCCDKLSLLVENVKELLFINKPLFLTVVKKDLSLFQYILGPQITPKTLLSLLLSNSDATSILKHNKALIGILLGFGMINSIYASRSENIYDALSGTAEIPPEENRLFSLPSFMQNQKDSLLFLKAENCHIREKDPLQTSVGFHTLEEEYFFLEDHLDTSSTLMQKPSFMFGHEKTSWRLMNY